MFLIRGRGGEVSISYGWVHSVHICTQRPDRKFGWVLLAELVSVQNSLGMAFFFPVSFFMHAGKSLGMRLV